MRIEIKNRIVTPQPIDYGAVRSLSAALQGRYSQLRWLPLGHSVQGRDISALVLSTGGCDQRVLMAATFHGPEWLTALCTLRLCEELCVALQGDLPLCGISISRALQGRQIWFVPLVNPDGLEMARYGSPAPKLGRWNAHGVDINSNFNAGWEEMQALAKKNDKKSCAYLGPSPESEPETRALTDLCRRYAFRHVVALHSQGEEIYWSYGEDTPPQSWMMAQILGEVSGYRVTEPSPEAAHGGFKDWFIRCYHRPGFTIELGRGENPLPLAQFEEIYEKAREMLVLSVLL